MMNNTKKWLARYVGSFAMHSRYIYNIRCSVYILNIAVQNILSNYFLHSKFEPITDTDTDTDNDNDFNNNLFITAKV